MKSISGGYIKHKDISTLYEGYNKILFKRVRYVLSTH